MSEHIPSYELATEPIDIRSLLEAESQREADQQL